MDMGLIVDDALKYPFQSLERVVILGAVPLGALILVMVVVLLAILTGNDLALGGGFIIASVLLFFSGLFVAGYFLRVIETSLTGEGELPGFGNRGELVINGLKLMVLQIVYLLVPALVLVLGVWAVYSSPVPAILMVLMLVGILVLLVFFIFGMFMLMATARLAASGLKAAFQFRDILQRISKIGWGDFLLWYLIVLILIMVAGAVMLYLSIIPIIGMLVGYLMVQPYLEIMVARSVALVYLESE